ncbi:lanC-like protein 3 [Ixodes scapularis]|uniref:LanC-like protein 3 homolog n=1 Tax=Ixodes scapularis TaxID=6945 RepID=B7QMW6_IXOSC|nr:lanC-like protein 3 [Ixodes scapularis]EEC20188.1 conserved hypothetical protein [Ixodes scapularis]|eukprot:XP_002400333.1 conserved hypothetical protein [Ixodes scapularis]
MSKPKRYFANNLPDYDGSPIPLERELWVERCRDTVQRVFAHQGTAFDDCEGGLYVGVAGVAYMALRIAQSPHFAADKGRLLARAQGYMAHALSYADHPSVRGDRSVQAAFLLGNAGVWALAAVVANQAARQDDCDNYVARYAALADFCSPVKFLDCGSDELFVGRAGYLTGLLYLNSKLGIEVLPQEKVAVLLSSVVHSGREYARKHRSPCPLMYAYYDVEYLGAAHGLCSILLVLLQFPWFVGADPSVERDLRASVDFFLHVQTPKGNFPCDLDDVTRPRRSQDELVHWCHGAPGVVYLMAKAYQVWQDPRYLESCLRSGQLVWERGLLRKGPGICHGIAGSGYVFLLLYRLTGELRWLHRARQFAEFMFTDEFKQARTPDCPYSLYEGLAGTACFLADILEPRSAAFPFVDVF